jgi:probable F420-dependent oxidoreductase
MHLTKFGVFTLARTLGAENYGEAAAVAERLGFGALWLGGSPRLTELRPMLAGSERLVIASGIVNIWHYEPETLAEEFHRLEAEFPGRLLVGIGIGHPERNVEYVKPLTKSTEFLDGIAAAPRPIPPERMALAALGPKMLELAATRTLGPHPYFSTLEHTRLARARLGEGAWIAPEQALVIDEDAERARAAAREYARTYLELGNYTSNLRRLGWSEDDLGGGGSDELIDAVVPQGSAQDAARVAQAQLEAGASHVPIQTAGVSGVPVAAWTALAGALGLGTESA